MLVSFRRRYPPWVASDASLLYHYTTAVGLKGIIDEGAIHASDAEFLNDARELEFGREELYEALMAEAEHIAPEEELSLSGGAEYSRVTVMRSAASHLRPGGRFLRRQAHSAYVTCFCEVGDLLSQWRGYAEGAGYAIGFRRSALQAIDPTPTTMRVIGQDGGIAAHVDGPPLETLLVQVRYGSDAIVPAVQQVLGTIASHPVGHPGATGWAQAQRVLLPTLASLKDAAFQEEREWRLITVGSEGLEAVQFRVGALGLVPYIPMQLPPDSIAEIVIGPGANADLRKHGVIRFLSTRRGGNVSVHHSTAPYRG